MRTITIALFLSGCAGHPYAELGLGHDFEKGNSYAIEHSEVVAQYDLDCGFGSVEAGIEWHSGMRVAAYHQSCLKTSRFDEKVINAIVIKKKFGGVK